MKAVETNKINIVKFLLEKRVNINQEDFEGNTALHFAYGGKSDIVKLLVEAGAKLYVKNKEGSMPLHVAADKSDTEMIELLINAKVDIHCLGRYAKTALEICVEKSDLNTTTLLLQHGAEVNIINRRGITPLIYAVIKEDEKLVDILIAHKADLNFVDPNQNTPLINAVLKGNKSIVSLLIKAGANVNAASTRQYYHETRDLNKLFLNEVRGTQLYSPKHEHIPINELVRDESVSNVYYLYKRNEGEEERADVDLTTRTHTPLHIAAQSTPTIVHLLLEAGADVYVTDEQGRTPLHIAAIYGNLSVVKELCQFGANINAVDTFRNSPLFFSLLYNYKDIYKYLIESGADVNVMCDSQCSPLYAAVVHNNLELVELMMNHGALCDKGKRSELLMALSHANTDMSVMLLKHGANPNVKNNDETPALMLCLRLMKCGSLSVKYITAADICLHRLRLFSTGRKREYSPYTGFQSVEDSYETPKKVFICDTQSSKRKTLTLIKAMLDQGANVSSTDKNGNSCLHVAAASCSKYILGSFLIHKANVNHQNKNGETPLMVACMSGNVETAKILLRVGAKVFLVDKLRNTALHHSVRNLSGLLPLVKLVTSYKKIRSDARQQAQNAKARASTCGSSSNVQLDDSVNAPASTCGSSSNVQLDDCVNAPASTCGSTSNVQLDDCVNAPASTCGSSSNVQLDDCVNAPASTCGSSSNVQLDDCVNAPASTCGSTSNVQLDDCVNAPTAAEVDARSKLLINRTNVDGENALHMACLLGHINIVMFLIGEKCKINARSTLGETPLMIAVENYFAKIAKYLIDNKANVNIKNNEGDTVLHLAVEHGLHNNNYMLLHELAQKSANINETNNAGRTPLFYANNAQVVELLVEKGSDVDIQDKNGETALHLATKHDKSSAVYQLITRGANLDITSKTGLTALMYAADIGSLQILKHLVNLGADVNIRDCEGMNACIHAFNGLRNIYDQYDIEEFEEMNRYISVKECPFDILVSAGADVNITDNKNRSLIVHTLLNNETHKQHKLITKFLKLGVEPLVPEEHRYLLRDSSCYKQTYGPKSIYNINMNESQHMFQFFLINGIVLDFTLNTFCSYRDSNNLRTAFGNDKLNFVQFLIATGCIFKRDKQSLLREIRLRDKTGFDLDYNHTIQSELAAARREPWPLVKLAFIEVSTLLGTGPMREEKLKQTKLPPRLQRTLMFQEPISRLPVEDWSKIPLCFDPVQYETLPCPRPLLYYWPVGHRLVV
ncbi:serine/threonine-protein phosphatase 6 regulatory ankyrin repeat subunit A-like [Physella acuta]|uniref:serine/threonine-protein phosphatase 6 regulatory ankyrin repeat subunit A-like n=1 Tax=Physella acuta TaxID=109671 RepID=UPI0027DE5F76|nr:serine/threonine-protein phosphatase 6 regulatory ankyrin repeat subunit A-like [Physella acuta]